MSILDTIITLGSFCGMFSDLESCPHELITKKKVHVTDLDGG